MSIHTWRMEGGSGLVEGGTVLDVLFESAAEHLVGMASHSAGVVSLFLGRYLAMPIHSRVQPFLPDEDAVIVTKNCRTRTWDLVESHPSAAVRVAAFQIVVTNILIVHGALYVATYLSCYTAAKLLYSSSCFQCQK